MKFGFVQRVILAVGLICALGLSEAYVRASKDEPAPDSRVVISKVPTCSFSYGQCRKSCLSGAIPTRKSTDLNRRNESTCLSECNFLYSDCRD